eukprot:Skav225735  [mRNA]  locus=scaffold611:133631:134288:- [translate_table: standard]
MRAKDCTASVLFHCMHMMSAIRTCLCRYHFSKWLPKWSSTRSMSAKTGLSSCRLFALLTVSLHSLMSDPLACLGCSKVVMSAGGVPTSLALKVCKSHLTSLKVTLSTVSGKYSCTPIFTKLKNLWSSLDWCVDSICTRKASVGKGTNFQPRKDFAFDAFVRTWACQELRTKIPQPLCPS